MLIFMDTEKYLLRILKLQKSRAHNFILKCYTADFTYNINYRPKF